MIHRAFFQAFLKSIILCIFLTACSAAESSKQPKGRFGVFYGGQVRALSEMSLKGAKLPKLGFRLSHSQVSKQPRQVEYRLVRPGRTSQRIKEWGRLNWQGEQPQLDHLLPWPEKFRAGYWSLRVLVDGQLILDRSIYFGSAD